MCVTNVLLGATDENGKQRVWYVCTLTVAFHLQYIAGYWEGVYPKAFKKCAWNINGDAIDILSVVQI